MLEISELRVESRFTTIDAISRSSGGRSVRDSTRTRIVEGDSTRGLGTMRIEVFASLPSLLHSFYSHLTTTTMRSVTSIIIFTLSLSLGSTIGESQIPLFERLVGAGHIALGSSNQTDATYQGDNQNFGKVCRLAETESSTCGDYFDGRVDHALFCSPIGICAGRGAICGTDAACNTGTSM